MLSRGALERLRPLVAAAIAIVLLLAAQGAAAFPVRLPVFVAFFESWSDNQTDDPGKTEVANIAGYVSIVVLGFMRPDAIYDGDLSLAGTGLDFRYSGQTLRAAIGLLHRRHPGTRVLVSVGSAAYAHWDRLNPVAISRFVRDFGLDGVDIDFETKDPGCAVRADNDIACATDRPIIESVLALRQALPRPLLLSMSAPHVGAYYPRGWSREMPGHSLFAGVFRQPLRDPAVSHAVDFLNLMAYDTGLGYHPLAAVKAYRELFQGPIAIGVEPAPEYWGKHVYTLAEVARLADAVRREGIGGMMLYSLQKPPSTHPGWPDSRVIARQICVSLGLGGCDQPLF